MPELPEVETIVRGIRPYVLNKKITNVVIRHPTLRWPIPTNLPKKLIGKKVKSVLRRGKYIVFLLNDGSLLLHLGMSGHVRLLTTKTTLKKHDHVDILFSNKLVFRFNDPRRFGAIIWEEKGTPSVLDELGIEPLTPKFNGNYLYGYTQKSNRPIKSLIMDGKVVVGVGNIYAAEALFLAKIHPGTFASALGKESIKKLAQSIKHVLLKAIKLGGTTLKDYVNSEGKPGYFVNKLQVYGRAGLPCLICHSPLHNILIGQRNTVYCQKCQQKIR